MKERKSNYDSNACTSTKLLAASTLTTTKYEQVRLHGAHAENSSNCKLCPVIHLKLPDDEVRQNSKRQITHDCQTTVNVRDFDQDLLVHAGP